MREESHHHLIFQNSYVNVFFVEIPPHESTLPHHHDLPYISVPPGELMQGPFSPGAAVPIASGTPVPLIPYNLGNFSHSVSNAGNIPLRNIAIELVRPQGTPRNLCENIFITIAQPLDCPKSEATGFPEIYPLFETDEILVQSWEMNPDMISHKLDQKLEVLIAGMYGVSITSRSGIDSAKALSGGVLWIPADSKVVIKTQHGRWGHFIAITFKDSAPAPH
jgi:hypothetical protein